MKPIIAAMVTVVILFVGYTVGRYNVPVVQVSQYETLLRIDPGGTLHGCTFYGTNGLIAAKESK